MINELDKQHTELDELAAEIVGAGEDITSRQLELLSGNELLQQRVQALLDVRTAMQQKANPIDVEQKLTAWKAQRGVSTDEMGNSDNEASDVSSREKKHFVRSLYIKLAVAAVFAGVIVMAFSGRFHSLFNGKNVEEKQIAAVPGMIFQADGKNKSGISITTSNGKTVTLKSSGTQTSSISLSYLEEVLADEDNTEQLTLDVPFGSSADITLPDGTKVYMHPGAHLIFPNKFAGEKRLVSFEGEAYFKVAHDASHPFVVKTGNIETTVLGTEFNINTEKSVVTLINGRVQLVSNNASVVLKPHEQAVLNGSNRFTTRTIDVTPYESWRDGYLYFEQANLKDIMEEIGKNFNMSVVFHNQEAMNYRMHFITYRNKGITEAVRMMNEMQKANIHIKGNTIFVE